MTDKEFQAMLNGKKINWGSGEKAKKIEEEYKKRRLVDEQAKKTVKKKK